MPSAPPITGFHAHVYFDAAESGAAEQLCLQASERFGLKMGRVHMQPVGPHPRGSCQLTLPSDKFSEVIAYLMLNRGPYTVFVHAQTGDDWIDHTQGVMWLGESEALKLDIFTPDAST